VLSRIALENLRSIAELHQHWQVCLGPKGPAIDATYWIPFVIFDGIVIILTMYKIFSYRDGMNPTIRLLARDSIVYFIIMFATLLFNLLFPVGKGTVLILPAEYIACTAVARMMMNIRGLVFDDSHGFQEPNLSTLNFRTCQPSADA